MTATLCFYNQVSSAGCSDVCRMPKMNMETGLVILMFSNTREGQKLNKGEKGGIIDLSYCISRMQSDSIRFCCNFVLHLERC